MEMTSGEGNEQVFGMELVSARDGLPLVFTRGMNSIRARLK
jgi:hypothetical protein